MKNIVILIIILTSIISCKSQPKAVTMITDTVFCTHNVVLDEQNKIVPWYSPAENAYDHILYSEGILKDVKYAEENVKYTAATGNGIEYLRLSFKPDMVTVDGKEIFTSKVLMPDTYLLRRLGKGDYSLILKHIKSGEVLISAM
jgi:hypothetical protein